jgi:hypothetical protein
MAKLDEDNAADDDIQVISNPNDASKKEESPPDDANKKEESPPDDASKKEISPPKPIGSQKRERGRPRKIEIPKPTCKGSIYISQRCCHWACGEKSPAKRKSALQNQLALRKSNPRPQQVSPYKDL